MLELLTDPAAWASLLTLTALEIVLGIDNVIFLSIVSAKLPEPQARRARRIGLLLALVLRVALLFTISWMIGLTKPLFTVFELDISWRDIVLLTGGLFLLYKGTAEVHEMMEGEAPHAAPKAAASFLSVIFQIALLDLVFSLDSVITAVGMADHIEIMVTAIVISIGVMMVAAEPVSAFVLRHPTVKMLALSFLILIGFTLIADGMLVAVPKVYIYAAISFSVLVEALNHMAARARARRKAAAAFGVKEGE